MAKVKCGTLVSMVPCLSASWMPVWIFYFLYLRTSWLTHRVAFKPAAPSLSLQQPPPVPKVYIYIYILSSLFQLDICFHNAGFILKMFQMLVQIKYSYIC
jgi:hypothetical protein